VDFHSLALLGLMGSLHFRRLTIPCGARAFVRSFGLRRQNSFAIIPLPWRATASNP
jgi:hypothetical protein